MNLVSFPNGTARRFLAHLVLPLLLGLSVSVAHAQDRITNYGTTAVKMTQEDVNAITDHTVRASAQWAVSEAKKWPTQPDGIERATDVDSSGKKRGAFTPPKLTAANCLPGRHWELVGGRAACVCDGDLTHTPVGNNQAGACGVPGPVTTPETGPVYCSSGTTTTAGVQSRTRTTYSDGTPTTYTAWVTTTAPSCDVITVNSPETQSLSCSSGSTITAGVQSRTRTDYSDSRPSTYTSWTTTTAPVCLTTTTTTETQPLSCSSGSTITAGVQSRTATTYSNGTPTTYTSWTTTTAPVCLTTTNTTETQPLSCSSGSTITAGVQSRTATTYSNGTPTTYTSWTTTTAPVCLTTTTTTETQPLNCPAGDYSVNTAGVQSRTRTDYSDGRPATYTSWTTTTPMVCVLNACLLKQPDPTLNGLACTALPAVFPGATGGSFNASQDQVCNATSGWKWIGDPAQTSVPGYQTWRITSHACSTVTTVSQALSCSSGTTITAGVQSRNVTTFSNGSPTTYSGWWTSTAPVCLTTITATETQPLSCSSGTTTTNGQQTRTRTDYSDGRASTYTAWATTSAPVCLTTTTTIETQPVSTCPSGYDLTTAGVQSRTRTNYSDGRASTYTAWATTTNPVCTQQVILVTIYVPWATGTVGGCGGAEPKGADAYTGTPAQLAAYPRVNSYHWYYGSVWNYYYDYGSAYAVSGGPNGGACGP